MGLGEKTAHLRVTLTARVLMRSWPFLSFLSRRGWP